jgi:hypothetical protein
MRALVHDDLVHDLLAHDTPVHDLIVIVMAPRDGSLRYSPR